MGRTLTLGKVATESSQREALGRVTGALGAAMRTQGEIEAAVCDGIARFEQEFMGRGPTDIRAT